LYKLEITQTRGIKNHHKPLFYCIFQTSIDYFESKAVGLQVDLKSCKKKADSLILRLNNFSLISMPLPCTKQFSKQKFQNLIIFFKQLKINPRYYFVR